MQIEVVLSKRATVALRQPVSARMTDPADHFLASWRVETAEDHLHRKYYMVTNCPTLFTFLLPRTPGMRWRDLASALRTRLRFALLAASPPAEITIAAIVPVKGNPREVIGSMNDMRYLLAQGCTSPPAKDPEAELNHTPFSAIHTNAHHGFPDVTWHARLTELRSSSTV